MKVYIVLSNWNVDNSMKTKVSGIALNFATARKIFRAERTANPRPFRVRIVEYDTDDYSLVGQDFRPYEVLFHFDKHVTINPVSFIDFQRNDVVCHSEYIKCSVFALNEEHALNVASVIRLQSFQKHMPEKLINQIKSVATTNGETLTDEAAKERVSMNMMMEYFKEYPHALDDDYIDLDDYVDLDDIELDE